MMLYMYAGTEEHDYEYFCLLLCPCISKSKSTEIKIFRVQIPLFSTTGENSFFINFSDVSNRRKNEKGGPVGITCQMFSAPRVGEVKVWYKIPRKDYLPNVQCPAEISNKI